MKLVLVHFKNRKNEFVLLWIIFLLSFIYYLILVGPHIKYGGIYL
jgi:hypothetical protein